MHITKWKKPIWKGYIVYDFKILEKATLWRQKKYQWLPRVIGEKGTNWWSKDNFSDSEISAWYYNDRYMTLYICPNPQNIHQQEWTLTKLLTLGDNDVGSSVVISRGMLIMGEVIHVWEQGYMGNLCTYPSILLPI